MHRVRRPRHPGRRAADCAIGVVRARSAPALAQAPQPRDLEQELGCALARSQFRLVYQPIRGMRAAVAPAFEALLRWDHPVFGAVAPDRFIPLAERNGMILDIGDWVFRGAADACRRLRAECGQAVRVAVNVSALQLASRPVTRLWQSYLEQIGLPPDALTLEITEHVMSQQPELMLQHVAELGRAGFRFALDDFGTGYANLALLAQIPADCLKLDRSLTRRLPDSSRHRTIADSVIRLAHDLSMQVVAEGVESPAEAWITSEMGCDFAQGYWFGKPASAEHVARHLAAVPA